VGLAQPATNHCQACGDQIDLAVRGYPKRRKRFCDIQCWKAWLKRNPKKRVCPQCQQEFEDTSGQPHRRFCSTTCLKTYHNPRGTHGGEYCRYCPRQEEETKMLSYTRCEPCWQKGTRNKRCLCGLPKEATGFKQGLKYCIRCDGHLLHKEHKNNAELLLVDRQTWQIRRAYRRRYGYSVTTVEWTKTLGGALGGARRGIILLERKNFISAFVRYPIAIRDSYDPNGLLEHYTDFLFEVDRMQKRRQETFRELIDLVLQGHDTRAKYAAFAHGTPEASSRRWQRITPRLNDFGLPHESVFEDDGTKRIIPVRRSWEVALNFLIQRADARALGIKWI